MEVLGVTDGVCPAQACTNCSILEQKIVVSQFFSHFIVFLFAWEGKEWACVWLPICLSSPQPGRRVALCPGWNWMSILISFLWLLWNLPVARDSVLVCCDGFLKNFKSFSLILLPLTWESKHPKNIFMSLSWNLLWLLQNAVHAVIFEAICCFSQWRGFLKFLLPVTNLWLENILYVFTYCTGMWKDS